MPDDIIIALFNQVMHHLNISYTVVAVAYSENLDFVIQRVFNGANFRAETQPFTIDTD